MTSDTQAYQIWFCLAASRLMLRIRFTMAALSAAFAPQRLRSDMNKPSTYVTLNQYVQPSQRLRYCSGSNDQYAAGLMNQWGLLKKHDFDVINTVLVPKICVSLYSLLSWKRP